MVREETKAKGRRVYLEKPRSSVTASNGGGSRRRRRWFAMAGDAVFLLSLSSVFRSLLCFLFFLSAFPLSFLFSSCPLSSVFSPFSRPPFLFCPSCFYRQKQGRDMPGPATMLRPFQHMESVELCRRLFDAF